MIFKPRENLNPPQFSFLLDGCLGNREWPSDFVALNHCGFFKSRDWLDTHCFGILAVQGFHIQFLQVSSQLGASCTRQRILPPFSLSFGEFGIMTNLERLFSAGSGFQLRFFQRKFRKPGKPLKIEPSYQPGTSSDSMTRPDIDTTGRGFTRALFVRRGLSVHLWHVAAGVSKAT